jgi:hypothetical protein
MIHATDIADWLRSKDFTGLPGGIDGARSLRVVPDPAGVVGGVAVGETPDSPDRLAAVRIGSGGPTAMERTHDRVALQIITRGLQGSTVDAEAVASLVDNLLMGAVPPLAIGPRRVISIDYVGGPPTFIETDSARRVNFSCNYLLIADREVF